MCPVNTYASGAGNQCSDCAAGQTSVVGSAGCGACDAGKYAHGAGVCIDCMAGKYSPAGANACSDCPEGSTPASKPPAALPALQAPTTATRRRPSAPTVPLGSTLALGPRRARSALPAPFPVPRRQCQFCAEGKIAAGEGLSTCTTCAVNTYASGSGACARRATRGILPGGRWVLRHVRCGQVG